MINQQQFGTPAGNSNILAPLQEGIKGAFDKRIARNEKLRTMVVGHELQSMRDERKFGHERGMLEAKQGHELTLQERGMKHARSQGRAQRKHELESKRLDIAGHVLKQNTAFEGIERLGKGKRVSNFSATADGGMNVTFNKPTRRRRSSTTPGAPTVVEPTTPQRSTATPDVPTGTTNVAPVTRDPKTGRAMRNPAYTPKSSTTSTPAAKATPKAARKPRSK